MRQPSVILSEVKASAKEDIGQINNKLADIARRRKEEIAEHRKQLDALDREEEVVKKELVRVEAKLLMVDNVAKARKKFKL